MGFLAIMSRAMGLLIMAVVMIRDIPPSTIRIHEITEMDVGRFFIRALISFLAERQK